MRLKLSLLSAIPVVIMATPEAAFSQETVDWTGPYAFVFGEYADGSSSQNDSGFAYQPPVAHATKIAASSPAVASVPTPVVAPAPAPVVAPAPPAGPVPVANPECPSGFSIDGACTANVNADGHYSLTGAFGGGGIGYNYQNRWLLLGVEGDIGGGRASGSSMDCGTPLHQCGTSIDAISDMRARLGYAYGRFLPFVAGGLAVDDIHAYDRLFGASGAAWRAGYVVGAGIEYKISSHFSIRAEYLHTEIGSSHLFDIVPNVPERIAARTDAARVSLIYAFTRPAAAIVEKY